MWFISQTSTMATLQKSFSKQVYEWNQHYRKGKKLPEEEEEEQQNVIIALISTTFSSIGY